MIGLANIDACQRTPFVLGRLYGVDRNEYNVLGVRSTGKPRRLGYIWNMRKIRSTGPVVTRTVEGRAHRPNEANDEPERPVLSTQPADVVNPGRYPAELIPPHISCKHAWNFDAANPQSSRMLCQPPVRVAEPRSVIAIRGLEWPGKIIRPLHWRIDVPAHEMPGWRIGSGSGVGARASTVEPSTSLTCPPPALDRGR
jgi:hypothetical protein